MNKIFDSLIGNDKLKALLTSDIINRTVHHAYIIEGPPKCGKHLIAESIIKGLACTAEKSEIPCGHCRNCKRLLEKSFADITYINKGENATVSVETVRKALETLAYCPNEDSDYKFYIIEEAEKMTVQAQNALLLSLEEPPEYAVFFLLTTDSQMLLETVRSRALTLKCQLFSPGFIAEYLKSQKEFSSFDADRLKTAAALSKGSLGYAAEILRGGVKISAMYDSVCRFTENLCKKKRSENLLLFSSQKFSRQDCDTFLTLAMSAVRDLIAYKNGCTSFTFYTNPDDISPLCSRITVAALVRAEEQISRARENIIRSNANINLVLTLLAASAV